MSTIQRLIGIGVVVFTLSGAALGQELRSQFEPPPQPVTTAPVVTATASAKRVRFVSPGSVVQLRLEVFNESGQKLFDTELRGGNVLDWYFQDGAGEPLPAGSYACVLTIKSLSGRLSQRVGRVTVDSKQALFEVADSSQLSLTQQQTIGPVEGGGAFTVLQDSGAEAITAVTHDGIDGQVGRTRGALSFRSGDLFAGKDTEQMRLTESGNLGIGTAEPQAKLDVAGDIRSSGRIRASGVEFPDGTVQVTGTSGRLNEKGELEINPASSGTLNKVAKWVDNADTLGNSAITEVNGFVGINTSTPSGLLHLGGAPIEDVFAGMGTHLTTGPAFNFGYSGHTFGRGSGFFNVRPDASAVAPNPSLRFMTANVQRMIVTNTGTVGIGTTLPGSLLDVAGNINTSTQYNIGGNRILSNPGLENLFAGVNAGAVNTGSYNAFFGFEAGQANTSGGRNAFFGANAGRNNTTGQSNTAVGYLAGRNTTNGSGNSFFGDSTGTQNTSGGNNSFFGHYAGHANQSGEANSFFGMDAGRNNETGGFNAFFGHQTGHFNTASSNSFFGAGAGNVNSTGGSNSFFGHTAGAKNSTAASNSFFGAGTGFYNTIGAFNAFFGAAAGSANTSASNNSFFGYRSGVANTGPLAIRNSFFGYEAGVENTAGNNNSFFGASAGPSNTTGLQNSFFGASSGSSNTDEDNNTFIGALSEGAADITNATALGYRAQVTQSNSLVLGGVDTVNGANANTKVGIGTTAPNARLHVALGDVAITTQSNGLILRATDGTNCYRVTVNDVGVLSTTLVTCP